MLSAFREETDIESPVDDETREQIKHNLTVLRMSDECIERILNAVERMPCKNHVKGALKFLTAITDEKSRREEYYQISNYIAEFFCTISNLGLFAVGIYFKDFAVLLAASFSAISHAIPLQRLNDLDKIGVLAIFIKAAISYKLFMERPELLAWGAGALVVNVLDTYISRRHLDRIGPSLHVLWHLSAALALYKIDQAQVEVSAAEIQNIVTAAVSGVVPGYLNDAYEAIASRMARLAEKSTCTII